MSLKQIFGQYVGQHVPMVEHGPEPQGHWDKGDYHGYKPPSLTNIPDPVLQAMAKTAVDNGLSLRVVLAGQQFWQDYQPNRVTASIGKDSAGVWRVEDYFELG